MFKDEIFQQFLCIPSLNDDTKFYINLLQKNGKLQKKAFSLPKLSNTRIKVSYKDHLAQVLEKDVKHFDREARAGIRTTAYQEWLLAALIHIVQLDLKGHPLTQKDSDFTKITRELAKPLYSQLEAQACLGVACTLTRRKLTLAEIGWNL